jgi:hypothetical protein
VKLEFRVVPEILHQHIICCIMFAFKKNSSHVIIFLKFLLSGIGKFQVHFIEMDPWVVSDVLRPNLEWTGFLDVSVIHTVRVEKFLERAEQFVGI